MNSLENTAGIAAMNSAGVIGQLYEVLRIANAADGDAVPAIPGCDVQATPKMQRFARNVDYDWAVFQKLVDYRLPLATGGSDTPRSVILGRFPNLHGSISF